MSKMLIVQLRRLFRWRFALAILSFTGGLTISYHYGWRIKYDPYTGKIVPVNIFAKPPLSPVSEAHVGWIAYGMVATPLAQDEEFKGYLFAAYYFDRRADNIWAGTVVAPLANAKFREVLADRLAERFAVRNQISQAEARQLVFDGCDFILNEFFPHWARPGPPSAVRFALAAAFFMPGFLVK